MRREPKLFSGKPVAPEAETPELRPDVQPVRDEFDQPAPSRPDSARPEPVLAHTAARGPAPNHAFTTEERKTRKRRRFPFLMLFVLVLLGGLAYAGWKGYEMFQGQPSASRDVPLFTADTAAFKVEPDDPGGLEVDNQGTLILEETLTGEESGEFEVLLPEPEEPLAVDVVTGEEEDIIDVEAAPITTDPIFSEEEVATLVESVLNEVENSVPNGLPLPTIKPEPPAERPEQLVELAVPENDLSVVPESTGTLSFDDVAASLGSANSAGTAVPEAEISDGPVEEVQSATAIPQGTGVARVQIAAYSSRDAADAAWARLYQNHNDLLANVDALILEAVISGTSFFRLQVGAYDTKAGAEALCTSLKQRDVDCLVVGP
jgi:hypothetical protein